MTLLTIDSPLHQTPQRIVCLVPSLREALFAFGVGDFIVGITDCYTELPPCMDEDYHRWHGNRDVYAILRVAPDLVVANGEENRREEVEHLQMHGISVFI